MASVQARTDTPFACSVSTVRISMRISSSLKGTNAALCSASEAALPLSFTRA